MFVAILLFGAWTSSASAQGGGPTPESESAGRSRGGYAWGEAPPEEEADAPSRPYRRYGHVFGTLGFGGTIRLLAHASVCDPADDEQCRYSPAYMQLRGGYLFESEGPIQHGVGLGIGTNLMAEGTVSIGIDPFAQWMFSPTYHIRYWFDSWFQLIGHVGIPLGVTAVTGDPANTMTDFNWGIDVQVGAIFKFLTGLGVYAAANLSTWFAGDTQVWPTLSIEGGIVVEYEVLP